MTILKQLGELEKRDRRATWKEKDKRMDGGF